MGFQIVIFSFILYLFPNLILVYSLICIFLIFWKFFSLIIPFNRTSCYLQHIFSISGIAILVFQVFHSYFLLSVNFHFYLCLSFPYPGFTCIYIWSSIYLYSPSPGLTNLFQCLFGIFLSFSCIPFHICIFYFKSCFYISKYFSFSNLITI